MASGKDYMFSALAIFCLEDYRPKTHLMDRIKMECCVGSVEIEVK